MILSQQRYFAAKTNRNQKSRNRKAVMLFGAGELGSWRNPNGVGAEGDSQGPRFYSNPQEIRKKNAPTGTVTAPEKSLITGCDLLAK